MRRVRFGGAISLDGFIAGPDGQFDWIVSDPALDFEAMFAQYDTLLIGRRTWTAMVDVGNAAPMPGITAYVFSRTLRPEDCPGATLVSSDAAGVVARLKTQPGKDIALYGGGLLFRSLLDAGLVDTVEVSLIPVLLGDGIPLLPPPYGPVGLTLMAQRVLPTTGTISLEYAIIGGSGSDAGRRAYGKATTGSSQGAR